jgi:two-component system, OmpR family, response regulator ResD
MTAARVLLVEDDLRLRTELLLTLSSAGYEVDAAPGFEAALRALEVQRDLLLLDLGLPDGDGLELCQRLRVIGNCMPILLVTARDQLEERVRGLDLGADDYLTKPYHNAELLARVRSLLRRHSHRATGSRLTCGELWLDRELRRAGRGEQTIALKPREFELLEFLLRQPGRAWTREQLLARVWGPRYDGDVRTVDSHVRRLRLQIEVDAADPRLIETVWGVGYRLSDAHHG